MRRLLPFLVLASCLLLAPPAFADAGSITITDRDAVGGQAIVTVSATITNTGCETSACDWVTGISRVGAGQPCSPANLVLTRSGLAGAGTQTVAFPDPTYVTAAEPRLCLYFAEAGPSQLLAQLDVPLDDTVPPPPTDPEPEPEPQPVPRPALTVAAAKRHVKPILGQVFKARFKHRRGFHSSCTRTRRSEVRCIVRWKHGRFRFKGPLWITASPGSSHGVTFDEQIRRTRIRG